MLPPELRQRLQKKAAQGACEGQGEGAADHDGDLLLPQGKAGRNRKPSAWRAKAALFIDDGLVVCAAILSCFCLLAGRIYAAALLVVGCCALLWRVLPKRKQKRGLRVVCISDTHGCHRSLGELPAGDILVHAGDFTKFGRLEDAEDFNQWLGALPFEHKIVVNGNHENNAHWQAKVREILSNATFLKAESTTVKGVKIYGTDFCWPMKTESPLYAQIPGDTDVVIAHGPAKGLADGGMGCLALQWAMARVRPLAVISGHIHDAHGVCDGFGVLRGTKFVNAANCGPGGYRIGWGPIVLDL
eukprot:TRINITY_DN26707_c0_g1_i1.p1 TRINITY_DN26707_c0_g1~~TRINITY_DN26707_c0_g1_i1.p1  ORF type:complete len:301 (+),score=38.02 TRINITY_DN26707_c0_g1_i1:127-1029(+)